MNKNHPGGQSRLKTISGEGDGVWGGPEERNWRGEPDPQKPGITIQQLLGKGLEAGLLQASSTPYKTLQKLTSLFPKPALPVNR